MIRRSPPTAAAEDVAAGSGWGRRFGLAGWQGAAAVSFAGGLIVATALAVFSARSVEDLGTWWLLALLATLGTWLAVVGGSWAWRGWLSRAGFISRDAPHWARFWALTGFGLCVLLLVGLFRPFSPFGLVFALWPLLVTIAFLWTRDGRIELGSAAVAGVVVFLICMRLFTLPGDPPRTSPTFAKPQGDDIRVLNWNIGGGPPRFGAGREGDIAAIAKVIIEQDAHVVCLQEVPSQAFVDRLVKELGAGWRGRRSEGEVRSSAVLSRFGREFESPSWSGDNGASIVLKVKSARGWLNFVSCHAPGGRRSVQRRELIDWVLNSVRDSSSRTVVAGDFGIDPQHRWSFISPLITDAASFDRATWRILNVFGTDPGFGGEPTGLLGRRTDWVIVDSKMSVTDYRVLRSARTGSMDHAPVLTVVGLGRAGREPGPNALAAPSGALLDAQP